MADASDLKFAPETVAQQFYADTGRSVKLSFGSSGNFFRQISQSAPFEVFLSADEHYVLELEKQGVTAEPGRLYGLGRLVIFAPAGSTLIPDAELKGLDDSINRGAISCFAIANPEHAPLRQRVALLKNAGATARAFYQYLQQAKARVNLSRYGFTLS